MEGQKLVGVDENEEIAVEYGLKGRAEESGSGQRGSLSLKSE